MSSPVASQRQIIGAAVAVFARKGFHGSTIREISSRAGVSVPGLYHHFSSKEHLLERIMDDTMDSLIETTEEAASKVDTEPADRLQAIVAAHVRFHIEFQSESFVGNTEIRSLNGRARDRVLSKRDRQRAFFAQAISDGERAGCFSVPYPVETTRGMVTMCTAVATWYRPNRPLSPEQIVRRYCTIALMMVGHIAAEATTNTNPHHPEEERRHDRHEDTGDHTLRAPGGPPQELGPLGR